MQLSENKFFIEEYKDFSARIENISNPTLKLELSSLLNKLLGEVKEIDRQHQDLYVGQANFESLRDHRDSLAKLRKKLSTKLADSERISAKK